MSVGFVMDTIVSGPELAWRDRAACSPSRLPEGVTADDVFVQAVTYPRSTGSIEATRRAISVCETCAVRSECAADAAGWAPGFRRGVWGGEYFGQGSAP